MSGFRVVPKCDCGGLLVGYLRPLLVVPGKLGHPANWFRQCNRCGHRQEHK